MLKSIINTFKEDHKIGPSHPGFTVLVADDNESYHELLANILSQWQVDVYGAHNGKEALVVLEHRRVDLVFMDIVMPEISGVQATDILRKFETFKRAVPVYVVGISGSPRPENYQEIGMNEFLQKPFSVAEVNECVENFFNYRRYIFEEKRKTLAPFKSRTVV